MPEFVEMICSNQSIRNLILPVNLTAKNTVGALQYERTPFAAEVSQRIQDGNRSILECSWNQSQPIPDAVELWLPSWLLCNRSLRRQLLNGVYEFLLIRPFPRDITLMLAELMLR